MIAELSVVSCSGTDTRRYKYFCCSAVRVCAAAKALGLAVALKFGVEPSKKYAAPVVDGLPSRGLRRQQIAAKRLLVSRGEVSNAPDMRVGQHSPLSWRTSFRAW